MKKLITIFLFIYSINLKANSDSSAFVIDAIDVLTMQPAVGGQGALNLGQVQQGTDYERFE